MIGSRGTLVAVLASVLSVPLAAPAAADDRQLLFGDVYQGYIRGAMVRSGGSLHPSQHLFHLVGVTSMDIGPDGYIYGTKMFRSGLFRVIPRGD